LSDYLASLIHRVDIDELVRYVDNVCASGDFPHLIDVRDQARAAVNSGRQLWPIATLANYRLALYAPGPLAVRALDDTARTFMPGPLSEILAVHHTWDELSEHLVPGPDRSLFAYERALRGDNITTDESNALDIPLVPLTWEPNYPVASYDDEGVTCDPPALPSLSLANSSMIESNSPSKGVDDLAIDDLVIDDLVIDDEDTDIAVRELFSSWTTESNGTVAVTIVEGSIADALSAHGLANAPTSPLTTQEAFSWLAWAGASGGAHGTRRGMATGRFGVWWLCATITDTADEWPLHDPMSHEAIKQLAWHQFLPKDGHQNGWVVHFAVHDPLNEISVCIEASDSLE
jgi:hypothetical protein